MTDSSVMNVDVRTLYIDLLQNILTNEIYGDAPIDPWSGGHYDPAQRALGRDWPSQAFTMIGTKRMANLRQLMEHVIAADIPGDFIETGVWRGGACIYMRGILKAYGITDRRVWVADSFEGLPVADPNFPQDAGDVHHTFTQLAISQDQVEQNFAKLGLLDDQVRFLKGWFKDTLPGAPIDRLAILRLDGDMYGSTWDALSALYHKVSPFGFVIVDDWGAVPACREAVMDFRAAHNIESPVYDIDGLGAFWQVA